MIDTLRHNWAAKLTYFNREMNGHRNVMNLLAGKPVAPSVNTVMAYPCMAPCVILYFTEKGQLDPGGRRGDGAGVRGDRSR